jgi:D-sedoheptulose 7-phosphate isomerase
MELRALHEQVEISLTLKRRFFEARGADVLTVGREIAARVREGARVLAFGNGGSAADAQHLVAELVVRFAKDRRAISAIALTTDPSILTATANDLGYEKVFCRQIEAHGRPGDVAIGISTSGRSQNVVQALRTARDARLLTIGLTGDGGGDMAGVVDHLIAVPHTDTARIQEVHAMVVHMLCEIVEDGLER